MTGNTVELRRVKDLHSSEMELGLQIPPYSVGEETAEVSIVL